MICKAKSEGQERGKKKNAIYRNRKTKERKRKKEAMRKN